MSHTPGVAFALGVASHFMLDLIPHGDSQLYVNYKEGQAVKKSLIYVAVDSVPRDHHFHLLARDGAVRQPRHEWSPGSSAEYAPTLGRLGRGRKKFARSSGSNDCICAFTMPLLRAVGQHSARHRHLHAACRARDHDLHRQALSERLAIDLNRFRRGFFQENSLAGASPLSRNVSAVFLFF